MTHPRATASLAALGLVLVASLLRPAGAARHPACFRRAPTIEGTAGPDILEGTADADVIRGLAGNDLITGAGGGDRICAGRGADVIVGDDGSDLVAGGGGADAIDGGPGNDVLQGGRGDDPIDGGDGDDACFQYLGTGSIASCVPTIAAAGDIACDPSASDFNGGRGTSSTCRMRATSRLLLHAKLDAVLSLGDEQYENGALEKFRASYDPTWGRVKEITHPAPGNHEYLTSGASGYFDYFGTAAGDRSRGYYGFTLGGWRLVALNSNCWAVGGCGRGTPQDVWLRDQLASHPAPCTLAYWHHPRFSSGPHGNDPGMRRFWRDLYRRRADLVLSGHDHIYERFAPQTPGGSYDRDRGIREFVVGTGGKVHYPVATVRRNSRVRNDRTFGVLEIALRPTGYVWFFFPEPARSFTDWGRASCHPAP